MTTSEDVCVCVFLKLKRPIEVASALLLIRNTCFHHAFSIQVCLFLQHLGQIKVAEMAERGRDGASLKRKVTKQVDFSIGLFTEGTKACEWYLTIIRLRCLGSNDSRMAALCCPAPSKQSCLPKVKSHTVCVRSTRVGFSVSHAAYTLKKVD